MVFDEKGLSFRYEPHEAYDVFRNIRGREDVFFIFRRNHFVSLFLSYFFPIIDKNIKFLESKMKIAYFDCFSGASGDMILGALIDAGLSPLRLREELKRLHLPAITVQVKKVLKRGLAATQVTVE